ncbi:hypothetical protein EON81_17280 [bacterium]|nr:MAG: hypothetical protein EON81_17280 [bacterium]
MDETSFEHGDGHISDVGMLDLRFAKTPEDLKHIRSISDVGVVLVPDNLAAALSKIKVSDVGTVVRLPSGDNVACHMGQIRMSGEALAGGPEGGVLVVVGQFQITSVPSKIGYREIRVIGQLFAPRGSEAVIGPKLTEMNGQIFYLPTDARMIMGEETISQEFLEYLEDGTTFVVMGELRFDDTVDVPMIRQKIAEIVLMGEIRAPRAVVPILQVITKEKYGEIHAEG